MLILVLSTSDAEIQSVHYIGEEDYNFANKEHQSHFGTIRARIKVALNDNVLSSFLH